MFDWLQPPLPHQPDLTDTTYISIDQDLVARADRLLPVLFYHGARRSGGGFGGGSDGVGNDGLRKAGAAGKLSLKESAGGGAAEPQPALFRLAQLASDAVETLTEALQAAAAGSLPLLLTSATHAR